MALNLTLDQGNSSTKVALWNKQGDLVGIESHIILNARDIAHLAYGQDIDGAIFCSVSRRPGAMMRALERRAARVIEFSANTPIPLTVDYKTPNTLGLDRLAAAVGAYDLISQYGPHELLVVDMGTAITYDRVTADRHYKGGNIAPGIFMRLKALNHYTARLPLVDPKSKDVPLWGNDTHSALLAGAVRGVVAELEYYHLHTGPDAKVVLTGGYADLVAPLLSFNTLIEPNLVSWGLNKIIEYNT